MASYGPDGVSAELAVYGLACSGGGPLPDPIQPVAGKIAIVDRGGCWFSDKLLTAQKLGAVGVIMLGNPDEPAIRMDGNPINISIPAAMVDYSEAASLRMRVLEGESVEVRLAQAEQGLLSDDVRAIAFESSAEGRVVWLGTWGGGLARISPDGQIENMTSATSNGGLLDDRIISIAIDDEGTKWIGTDQGGLSRLDSTGQWLAPMLSDPSGQGPVSDRINAVAFDELGRVWVASGRFRRPDWSWAHGGVGVLDHEGQWVHYLTDDGLADSNVLDIISRGNEMWMATGGGISRLILWPSENCAEAREIHVGQSVSGQLGHPSQSHLYRFDIDTIDRELRVVAPDLQNHLRIQLYRSCSDAGSGAGRRIGSGAGRRIGPNHSRWIAGEQTLIHAIGLETGTYYLEVSSDVPLNPAAHFPLSYNLISSLWTVDSSESRSLIITDRMALDQLYPEDRRYAEWLDTLELLAAQTQVRAEILDLGDIEAQPLADRVADWKADPTDTRKSNQVALAIRDWIWAEERDMPYLRYVLILGDDRVVPHYRQAVPLEAGASGDWSEESAYVLDAETRGSIDSSLGVYTALSENMTLTDDVFATPNPVFWPARNVDGSLELRTLHVPRLSVGRLVESPSTMLKTIDRFLAMGGEIQVDRSMVAGWDFMQDGPQLAHSHLRAAMPESAVSESLIGDDWTAEKLNKSLIDLKPQLAYLGVHANHFAYECPAPGSVLRAEAVQSIARHMNGGLAYGLACHGGLNIPGDNPTGPSPDLGIEALDMPQAWTGEGSQYVGSTGWAYGMHNALGYQELLFDNFTRELLNGGGSTIGKALTRAKAQYFAQHALNHYHVKTLAGTIFYGLPMTRMRFGSQGSQVLDEPQLAHPRAVSNPYAGPGNALEHAPGFERVVKHLGEVPAQRNLRTDEASRDQESQRPDQGNIGSAQRKLITYPGLIRQLQVEGDELGNFYALPGRAPYAESGQTVMPKLVDRLSPLKIGSRVLPPKGTMLVGAEYQVKDLAKPRLTYAGLLDRGLPTSLSKTEAVRTRFSPSQLFAMQPYIGDAQYSGVSAGQGDASLVLHLGLHDRNHGRQRLFDSVSVVVYHSDSKDDQPPGIEAVETVETDTAIDFDVRVGDDSGTSEVILLCDTDAGRWERVDLQLSSGQAPAWKGKAPRGSRCMVQAVDRAGNVSVDNANGHFYPIAAVNHAWLPLVVRDF